MCEREAVTVLPIVRQNYLLVLSDCLGKEGTLPEVKGKPEQQEQYLHIVDIGKTAPDLRNRKQMSRIF